MQKLAYSLKHQFGHIYSRDDQTFIAFGRCQEALKQAYPICRLMLMPRGALKSKH